MSVNEKQRTKFIESVETVNALGWKYVSDPQGNDVWTMGWKTKGDCEDYCFRIILENEKTKAKAVKAILTGKYKIWFAAANGKKPNHAILQYDNMFVEVIFKNIKEIDNPKRGVRVMGRMWLHKPFSRLFVAAKLAIGPYAPGARRDR